MKTKICSKCGDAFEASNKFFAKNTQTKDGLACWCKRCMNAYAAEFRKHHPDKVRALNNSPRARYAVCRNQAGKRRIGFELSFDEFMEFWQKPCHWCGSEIALIGLDRRLPHDPYRKDNVVPCCKICNWMKMDMGEDEWMDKMMTILKHQGVL